MKMTHRLMIGVLWLVLAACAGEEALPTPLAQATVPATRGEMTPTLEGETAVSPPATAPPSPTNTPPATGAPTLTATPSPTATPTPCPPGEVRSGAYLSDVAGESKYRVYLPPCYGDGRVYPALYLFAGNTQDETAWDEYGLDEAAEAAIRAGEIPPMIIVMADGGWIANNTSGGPNSFEGHVIDDLIPYIEETYCVWREPAGRAIGGLSRGGYWSLEIAFRHPEMFVSVGGHSAALIDSHAGPEINPQYTALSNDLGDLRIYLDIGEDDYLRPNTERLHEDMTAQGIPHTWALNEGAHEDTYWPAHLDEYLRWYGEPWPLDRGAYPAGNC